MFESNPDWIVVDKENVKENAVSTTELVSPAPVPQLETEVRELAFVDFSSPERVGKFVSWAIERSGLTKSEISRRLGVERVSFQPYYRGKRGHNLGVKWLVRFLGVVGARLYVDMPVQPQKPLRKRRK
jgi:hypothetical protein